ncbi:regulatory protein RecX [bacterium]|nr:regulatory protein RecX [bacterium]
MTEGGVHRVSAIERQKNNPGRVSIFLDGEFAFGLDEEALFKHPVHEGDELTDAFIDGALLADERVRAKSAALRCLSRRAMTTEEMRRKLEDRGFSGRTVLRVIGDLSRVGLLNDPEFAASYAASRMLQRPCSRRLLVQELTRKGIRGEDAEAAAHQAYGPDGEQKTAVILLRKKMAMLKGEDPRKARNKCVAFLVRRGFDWDVIRAALDAAGSENERDIEV